METYDIHVCLVSDQLVPNLLMAVYEKTRPRLLLLLVSEKMKSQGERLSGILRRRGCETRSVAISAFNYDEIWMTVADLVEQYLNERIALNVTGGTKLLSLATFDVFRDNHLPVFYVDTDNRLIRYLSQGAEEESIPNVLKTATLLEAYGYQIVERGQHYPKSWTELAHNFRVHPHQWEKQIGEMNWVVSGMRESGQLTENRARFSDIEPLLKLLEEHDVVHLTADQVEFMGDQALEYMNGGWLEEEAFATLERMRAILPIRDLIKNTTVIRGQVRNELDIVFAANNQLHVIECKTKRFRDSMKNDNTNTVYKLDSLTKALGGTYAKRLLLSYRTLTPDVKKRCKENGIIFIDKATLTEMELKLKQWIMG